MPATAIGLGLGQSVARRPTTAATPAPLWAADGRRVRLRETFEREGLYTVASPGRLGTVTSGSLGLLGGLSRGPQVGNGPPVSAGWPNPTATEATAGYTPWRSAIDFASVIGSSGLVTGGNTGRGQVSVWLRVAVPPGSTGARLIGLTRSGGAASDYEWLVFPADATEPETVRLYILLGGNPANLTVGGATVPYYTLRLDRWVEVSLAYEHFGGADLGSGSRLSALRATVREAGQSSAAIVHTFDNAVIPITGCYLGQTSAANQPGFGGRVGAFTVAEVAALTDITKPHQGTRDPVEEAHEFTLSAATGSDSNWEGPWATAAGVRDAERWNVLLGHPDRFQQGSTRKSYGVLATADDKDAALKGIDAGTVLPKGDVVKVVGDVRLTATSGPLVWPRRGGVLTGELDATGRRPVVHLDGAVTGTWTLQSGNVWKSATAGVAGAGLWQILNGDKIALRLAYYGLTDATGIAACEALPGSYYPDLSDGFTYVHAPGSVNPNTLSWERYAGVGGSAMAPADGVIERLIFDGGLTLNTTVDPNDQFAAAYHLAGGLGKHVTVYRDCLSRRWGKHGQALVGNGGIGGFGWFRCSTTHAPSSDYNYLAFSAWVYFSGDVATPGEAVVYTQACSDTTGRCVAGTAGEAEDPVLTSVFSHDATGTTAPEYARVTHDKSVFTGVVSVASGGVVGDFRVLS